VDFQCTSKLLGCTPKLLEWTLGALQIFGVNFECMIVYSKEAKKFGVEIKVSTPNILEWTAFNSKKIGVYTFPLQIGVHEVKSWSAFSLTQPKKTISPPCCNKLTPNLV
jgi:hypothetical protein